MTVRFEKSLHGSVKHFGGYGNVGTEWSDAPKIARFRGTVKFEWYSFADFLNCLPPFRRQCLKLNMVRANFTVALTVQFFTKPYSEWKLWWWIIFGFLLSLTDVVLAHLIITPLYRVYSPRTFLIHLHSFRPNVSGSFSQITCAFASKKWVIELTSLKHGNPWSYCDLQIIYN